MANFNIDYLVVAGGGGGGPGFNAGGGGAGGLITNVGGASLSLNTSTSYTVTVGAGGAGGPASSGNSQDNNKGANGGNSTFATLSDAIGGGGGGAYYNGSNAFGENGGSGGGAGYGSYLSSGGVWVLSGGTATTGQGNAGGGVVAGSYVYGYTGGGGGGAGSAGINGTPSSGNGGNGVSNNITGTSLFYAAGGGGGGYELAGSGGSSIGGNGSTVIPLTSSTSGTVNTGSGGGGTGNYQTAGAAGGSGIVILRYATADIDSYTTTGAAPTETTDGTDTILSFTTVGTGTITFTTPIPPFSGTKVTTPVTDFNKLNTEEGLKIPSGTSSNQPTGVEGMVRNDTTQSSKGSSSTITYYNGTNWRYFENQLNTSFNTVLFQSNNQQAQSITSVGFQPDLILGKTVQTAASWDVYDSIRGGSSYLATNLSNAAATGNYVTSFDPNGFSLGTDSNFNYYNNQESVAYCFKAGGLTNKAADFNGSSSRIDINSLANVLDAQNIVSTSFWFKSTSTSLSGLFSYRGSASSTVNMLVALNRSATGDIGLDSSTSSGFITLGNYNGGYNDGNWHHVVSVINYTTGAFNVYIDNTLRITGTNASISKGVSNKVQLGANYSSQYLNGSIGQARLFTSAISASQVTELYNETATDNSVLNFPNGAGCIAAYPLGENANGVDGLYNGTSSNVTFNRPGYLTRNNEGTIESTVSANNDLGFSIASYTGNGTAGSTVGHGLDSTPEMVIVKSLTTTANQSWSVYQVDVGNNGSLTLELANTPYYDIGYWNNTSPTSSVFTLGYYAVSNQNNANYIAYCFASKPNYSKVGSYLGNGNATGPTVTLGFEPAFVMIKGVNQSGDWTMLDNKRDTSNPNSARLDANDSMAEYNAVGLMDFNSDGFQIVTTQAAQNALNKTFIYLAFANTI